MTVIVEQEVYSRFIGSLKSQSAKWTYGKSISSFLLLHYPDEKLTTLQRANLYITDRKAIQREDRIYQFEEDINTYKQTIRCFAPKTQVSYIAAVIGFLDKCGHAGFSDSLKRELYYTVDGKEAELTS